MITVAPISLGKALHDFGSTTLIWLLVTSHLC
jgi:hypothetical protein